MFTSAGVASGFVNTANGMAQGNAAGGATATQVGSVSAMMGVGTLSFDGTTTSSGTGGFGAGFSPPRFNTYTTEVAGSVGSAPTVITTIVPVSTGPTGGSGLGRGSFNIVSGTTGTLVGLTDSGTGSSVGTATTYGEGMGSATNYFGTAGARGYGAGSATAVAAGSTANNDPSQGFFTSTGALNANFNNEASGYFGNNDRNSILTFP
jgi:hypothetical protein